MGFDELLAKYTGECGRYQILIIIALNVIVIPDSFNTMEIVFTSYTPDFWPADYNESQILVNTSDPCDCAVYDNFTENDRQCTNWEYDTSIIETSIVSEFDLVCDRKWMSALASSMYFFGFMAVFPFGIASDRFGRKPILFGCVLLNILTRIGTMFSQKAIVYIVLRFFVGVAHMSKYTAVFVLVTELVGPSQRLVVGTAPCFAWIVGCFLLELCAFAIRTRFYLELVPTVLMLGTVALLWFIPESPRWLYSQGRYEEGNRILKKMAKFNRRDFPDELSGSLLVVTEEEEVADVAAFDFKLLRSAATSRIMLLRTFVLTYNWFCITLLFYAITLNTGSLAGDLYLNTFLVSLVELPAYTVILLTLSRGSGRAISISAATIIAGIFVMSACALKPGIAATTLSLLGKLCITYAFGSVYIFTCELFPTTIRNLGVGLCSFVGRIGVVIAPLIATLGIVGTALVIGIMAVIAGMLLLLLPETRGRMLPQTVADAERMEGILFLKYRNIMGHRSKNEERNVVA